MKRPVALAALLVLIPAALCAAPSHSAATFGMNFHEFRKTLDKQIRDSTLDEHPDSSTTNNCRKLRRNYVCDFHDLGFRSSLESFKDLKIFNRDVPLNLKLEVETVRNRVSEITLTGDRSDPVNLFQFETVLQDIMRTFEPGLGYDEAKRKEIADRLGLLRSDDSDDIGKPRSMARSYAVITCLSQPASASTAITCTFVPNRASLQAMSATRG